MWKLLGASLAVAGTPMAMDGGEPAPMVVVKSSTLKWQDGPPVLPKGIKISPLFGDPGKPGLFILRAKLPANTRIPPHWHPTAENVSILSGTLFLGHGDKLDTSGGEELTPGSFFSMPASMHHYVYTKKETVLEITAMGPFMITYINPADDPSKAAGAK